MKKLVLILGNGLTMDLLSNLDEKKIISTCPIFFLKVIQ